MFSFIGEFFANLIADVISAIVSIFPLWFLGLTVLGVGLLFFFFGFVAIGGTVSVVGAILVLISLIRRNYTGNKKID